MSAAMRILVAAVTVAGAACAPRSLGSVAGSELDARSEAAPDVAEDDNSDQRRPLPDAGETALRDARGEHPAPPAAVAAWEPAGDADAGVAAAPSAIGAGGGEVVVGTTAGQLYASMGDVARPTWFRIDAANQAASTAPLGQGPITSVVIDPRDPRIIYVALAGPVMGRKLYKTETGGKTWTALGSGADSLSTLDIWSLSINPQDPQRLCAVVSDAVWYTADGGATWSLSPPAGDPLHPDFADPAVRISAIARGRDDDEVWVGGTDGEICYARHASANAWAAIAGPAMPTRLITRLAARVDPAAATDATDAATVYVTFAGISNDSLWRSPDNGAGWVNIHNPDLPTTAGPAMMTALFGVSINPAFPDTLYVIEPAGAHRSDDGGLTWFRQ